MTQILAATAPIYMLIAVGFFAVRSGLLSKVDNPGLGRFVLCFCVPPLLFRMFAQRKLGEVADFPFLAASAGGSLAVLFVALRHVRKLRGNTMPASAMQAMFIGIVAGIVYSALDLHLPAFVESTIALVATAASPVALFVIGGSLVGLRLQGQRTDIAAVTLGKLMVHPRAVMGTLWLMLVTDPTLATAAVIVAAMPMLSIYPVLGQKYGQAGFCAATSLGTTMLSFFTISALLWALKAFPMLFARAASTVKF